MGMERARSERSTASDGPGHSERMPARRELERLLAVIEQLDGRVTRNRADIDMQFQRLADLQAVIDRMQIAATKGRKKGNGEAE